jgi:hypothetical protein
MVKFGSAFVKDSSSIELEINTTGIDGNGDWLSLDGFGKVITISGGNIVVTLDGFNCQFFLVFTSSVSGSVRIRFG